MPAVEVQYLLLNEHKRVQQFRSDTKPRIHICAGERCLVGEWCM